MPSTKKQPAIAKKAATVKSAPGTAAPKGPTPKATASKAVRQKKVPGGYDAQSMKVLRGLDPVRKRPGMYIGSTGSSGLHHLLWEVVDNSVDEAMGGYCDHIYVTLHADGSAEVLDNGRGIPTDMNREEKMSGVEIAMTVLHGGAKFDKEDDEGSYNQSSGLHGVGVSVVNALSTWLEVTVDRDKKRHVMRFEDGGHKTGNLKVTGVSKRHGTAVRFLPDPAIFQETTSFDYETVASRLRTTASLNAGLVLTIRDERDPEAIREEVFCYKDGIREMVRQLNIPKKPIHTDIPHFAGDIAGETQPISIDIAFQYNETYAESFFAFANGVPTPLGGSHETGFRAAMTNVIGKLLDEYGTRDQKKTEFKGEDLREGLTAVVAVRLREAQFEGQTKEKLTNSEVRSAVQTFLTERLSAYLTQHQKTLKVILEKTAVAARSRQAAKRAREQARSTTKSALQIGRLAGKLADCSSNDDTRNELFIVEGDSAGGTAKEGRNRSYQAILPIKGKILNVERASTEKILANTEIQALVTAMDCGFGRTFKPEDLRYKGGIILMADADVDGAHIQTLLLTLYLRHFRELIEEGRIYLAQPPLFKIEQSKKVFYCYNDAERDRVLEDLKKASSANISVQRYKGLGEMNKDQLWETTMNPETRSMVQVTIDDALHADEVFSRLMGDEVAPRKEWISANAKYANLDI